MGFVAMLAVASASGESVPGLRPSRPPEKGCTWQRLSDARVGLEAWVQRCDFGFRKIAFLFSKGSLAMRYSDGGEAYPVVDVFTLAPGETPESGARRIFRETTDKALAARCVLVPYHDEFTKAPAGVERYTFVPDTAYAAELKAKGEPEGVPDPPCGDRGESPDGIGYWEAQPGRNPRKILFVDVGQDTPLFDEQTLRLLPAK
jgi:ADP-ribose pyrophosphatase YjhB (NUDIX family)